MSQTNISFYKKIHDVESKDLISMDILLDNIKNGEWQDAVLGVRTNRLEKTKLPSVTIAGRFSKRTDNSLTEHSGFLCIDIDGQDPSELKSQICVDPHVYAAFTSCGGNGLAVIFKIDPNKHKDAFYAISKHILSTYQIACDPTSVNVSRARFVSYDPDLYENPNAKTWKTYIPKKENPQPKLPKMVFVTNDFERMVETLESQNIDITDNYMDWLRIGFGIADKFGESGRDYFRRVSRPSQKFDERICDLQYNACLKSKGQGATIGTFYYLCSQAGIQTYSERTKALIKEVGEYKRKGAKDEEIKVEIMSKLAADTIEEIEAINVDEVIAQVTAESSKAFVHYLDLALEELINEYKLRYDVLRKKYTIDIYKDGGEVILESRAFATLRTFMKKKYEDLNKDELKDLVNHLDIPSFNPLKDWFEKRVHIRPEGVIKKFSDSINANEGLIGADRERFVTKWLVGMVASPHGFHSSLMLVLVGEKQNTGKTELFRRLLPEELTEWYIESKLDAGKDDEIAMCENWIIMDDEYGGKSKREFVKLKDLTSKSKITVRRPYGDANETLTRLAVLCGTTNDKEILNDPTGNRRIIPVYVDSINFDSINSIDRTELLMEAYHLWKAGYKYEMTKEDIELLAGKTEEYKVHSVEDELLLKYFELPNDANKHLCRAYTASDIVQYLSTKIFGGYRIDNSNRAAIGRALAKLGQKRVGVRFPGSNSPRQCYILLQKPDNNSGGLNMDKNSDSENVVTNELDIDLPF
jgi:hypothetical protein